MENPELENMIFADPDSPDAWAVYGDWLQSLEDPRGELIALELAHCSDPKNQVLANEIRKLNERYRPLWAFGFEEDVDATQLTWAYGFLSALSFIYVDGEKRFSFEELSRGVFRRPALKFLRSLDISLHGGAEWLQFILMHLENIAPLKCLQDLQIYHGNMSWKAKQQTMVDVTELPGFFPRLKSLSITTFTELKLSPFRHWKLENLKIHPGQFNPRIFASLADSELSRLRHLSLDLSRVEGLIQEGSLSLLTSPTIQRLDTLELILGSHVNLKALAFFNQSEELKHLKKFTVQGRKYLPRMLRDQLKNEFGGKLEIS